MCRFPEEADFLVKIEGAMATAQMPRHSLTDGQWELVEDLFPTSSFKTGQRPRDRRELLNAMFWVLRTGAPWRDVPLEFGPWKTAWNFGLNERSRL